MTGTGFILVADIVKMYAAQVQSGKFCRCPLSYLERGDSVLEERFWRMLRITKDRWHGAVDQFHIGEFRVDAAVDCDGKIVVIELDGRKFHDAEADAIRDASIIQYVDAIIRIPFAALWHYQYATFKVLAKWYPRFELPEHYYAASFEQVNAARNNVDFDDDAATWLTDMSESGEIYQSECYKAAVGTLHQFEHTTPKIYITRKLGKSSPYIREALYAKARCEVGHGVTI